MGLGAALTRLTRFWRLGSSAESVALSGVADGRALAFRRCRVTYGHYCLVSVSIGALITHAAALFPVAERQVEFPQKHLS